MDLDTFGVYCKIVEVCQHDPYIPLRDGSLLIEVSSPDESDLKRK